MTLSLSLYLAGVSVGHLHDSLSGHLHDDDGTLVPAALFFVSPEMEMLGAWFRGASSRYSIYYAVYLL
jgi:hypothetical protein